MGEEVTEAMVRARIRVDGRFGGRSAGAFGGADGGLQWLWRARWWDRTQREALADWAGASWRGRSVGRMAGQLQTGRQAGSGIARSRAGEHPAQTGRRRKPPGKPGTAVPAVQPGEIRPQDAGRPTVGKSQGRASRRWKSSDRPEARGEAMPGRAGITDGPSGASRNGQFPNSLGPG